MAGKAGRSGAQPSNIREYAETTVREVALPKMRAYLQKNSVSSEYWRWCHTEFCRLAGLNAANGEQGSSQEGALLKLA